MHTHTHQEEQYFYLGTVLSLSLSTPYTPRILGAVLILIGICIYDHQIQSIIITCTFNLK